MSDAKSPLTPAQQARRDRIVDAGLALLAERDYDKIQVKDVAEEANVALGTLYRYFSSKEHLFAEVLVRWAGTLRTNISPSNSGRETSEKSICRWSTARCRAIPPARR